MSPWFKVASSSRIVHVLPRIFGNSGIRPHIRTLPYILQTSDAQLRRLSIFPPLMDPIGAPYSGPPCRDTVNRRLSSPVNLQSYYYRKATEHKKHTSDFVDMHEGLPEGVDDYDVLITDLNLEKLSHEISDVFSISYLSDAEDPDVERVEQKVKGLTWGVNRRCMIALVVKANDKAKWVHFLWDVSSPRTYLSQAAAKVLGIAESDSDISVHIGGRVHGIRISPLNSYFPEVNIIGMDYIALHKVAVLLDPERKAFEFYYELAGKIKFPWK